MPRPLYDVARTFEDNIATGPLLEGGIPARVVPPRSLWHDFYEYKIASRIGVPACGITKRYHAALLAQLGYDVITYKTIRSHERIAHPVPNLTLIECDQMLTVDDAGKSVPACSVLSRNQELAAACSVGNPSAAPEETRASIAHVRAHLEPGQVLIVSVYGEGTTLEDVARDFARAARIALDGGAQVIELNLSCPNILGGTFLYLDPHAVAFVVKTVMHEIGTTTPVQIKVGIFDDTRVMRDVLIAGTKAGMRGVAAINSVKMKVVNNDGSSTFGQRTYGGVSGAPIRALALQTVRDIQTINQQEQLALTVLGTGGVIVPEHFDEFFAAGADIAMSATGVIWNPYLAHEYHQRHAMQPYCHETHKEL